MRRLLLSCGIAVLATAQPLAAQLAWETPRLAGPDSPTGVGIYWMRAGTLRNDGDAVLVTWTPPGTLSRITLRGGTGTGVGGDQAGFGGFDLRFPLARHALGYPMDVSVSVGVGVGVGDYVLVTAPIGFSLGRSWFAGPLWVAPYLSAGVAVDARMRSAAGARDRIGLSPAVDVGLDLALDRNRRFLVRVAAALGDRQALVVGAAIGQGRSRVPE